MDRIQISQPLLAQRGTGAFPQGQSAPSAFSGDTVSLGKSGADLRLIPDPRKLASTPESDRKALDALVSRITPKGAGKVADLELEPFRKRKEPVMKPSEEGFDSRNIYNMATVRENGVTYMLYRGEDKSEPAGQCTGRIGLATSKDGVKFVREKEPLIVPEHDYEKGGIEDPRLVKIGDTYYLTYSGYDGDKARLCLATSKDIRHWEKHGPVFPKFPPTDDWTKSGAILPEKMKDGPYKGSYIMYFGDTSIWMAHSKDLLHWTPETAPVIKPRKNGFDNDLVEPGPPPFLTRHGIVMIYNSNSGDGGEHKNYNVGAALFDAKNPAKMIARTDKPVMSPTLPWEKHGYIDNVVFAEGMAVHDGQVDLYYGGADRYIGLAVASGLQGHLAPAIVSGVREAGEAHRKAPAETRAS